MLTSIFSKEKAPKKHLPIISKLVRGPRLYQNQLLCSQSKKFLEQSNWFWKMEVNIYFYL